MHIEKTKQFTLVTPNLTNGGKEVENIETFTVAFNKNYSNFNNDNLIIDLSGCKDVDLKKILLLSPNIEAHYSNKKSFVIICKDIDIDELEEEINLVPTLQEAKDIIEMEDIERDLGF